MSYVGGNRIQRDKRSTLENSESIKPRLIWKLRGYSEKAVYALQSVYTSEKADFWTQIGVYSRKACLDMVLDSYFREIASAQVMSSWYFLKSFDTFSYCFCC